MARKQKASFLVQHYDKLILFVVMVLFFGSLAALILGTQSAKEDDAAFDRRRKNLKPQNPVLAKISELAFEDAEKTLDSSYTLALREGTHLLFAPERVACVKCNQPIEVAAEACPYCGEAQPSDVPDENWDSDADGMPDNWEKKYAFNPLDASDANGDSDGDGFTNLEEFKAETDPTNPKSHPPRYEFLRVQKVDIMPFNYAFRSKALLRGGNYRFSIRDKATGQDWWIEKGQQLAKTGFILDSYTNTVQEVRGSTGLRKVETYILTLKKGEDTVILRDNNTAPESSVFQVSFICTKDTDGSVYTVRRQESFLFDNVSFKLISIDRRKQTAVLQNMETKELLTVPAE